MAGVGSGENNDMLYNTFSDLLDEQTENLSHSVQTDISIVDSDQKGLIAKELEIKRTGATQINSLLLIFSAFIYNRYQLNTHFTTAVSSTVFSIVLFYILKYVIGIYQSKIVESVGVIFYETIIEHIDLIQTFLIYVLVIALRSYVDFDFEDFPLIIFILVTYSLTTKIIFHIISKKEFKILKRL